MKWLLVMWFLLPGMDEPKVMNKVTDSFEQCQVEFFNTVNGAPTGLFDGVKIGHECLKMEAFEWTQ